MAELRVEPTGGPLGAFVTGIDLTKALSPDEAAALRAAAVAHKVFRDRPIDEYLEKLQLIFSAKRFKGKRFECCSRWKVRVLRSFSQLVVPVRR